MKTLTGAEIVIECLKEQGVDTVFGYPGGAILNIYDALYKHKDKITHILTSHEQGASHAADGYARATGKVGVCMATSGPGATNLVTGIATANLDSIPMVAITCNVTTGLLGKDSFQEIDILGVTMPITKYNFIVKDVTKLADVIRRAFVIAKSGRPGPVLVDITKDVTAAACEYEPKEPQPEAINPFGQAFSRPIATPDAGAFEGPKDNTIFGNFHASNNIRPASDVFATLNPQAGNGNDSGLWTANQPNGAPEAKGQGAAEAKAEDEKPRFEYGIPAFLRKKN